MGPKHFHVKDRHIEMYNKYNISGHDEIYIGLLYLSRFGSQNVIQIDLTSSQQL